MPVPLSWKEFEKDAITYVIDAPPGGLHLVGSFGASHGLVVWVDGELRQAVRALLETWPANVNLPTILPEPPATAHDFHYHNHYLGFVSEGRHYIQIIRSSYSEHENGFSARILGVVPSVWSITTADEGPEERGGFYFGSQGGPYPGGPVEAKQSIDLTSVADLIDTGDVEFELSAYLGGISHHMHGSDASVTFLDANGDAVVSPNCGGVSCRLGVVRALQRNHLTGLFYREKTGFIVPGVRTAVITLTLFQDGDVLPNTAGADNVSFRLLFSADAELIPAFGDQGVLDTHTVTLDWGDSTAPRNPAFSGARGVFAIQDTYVYKDNGNYPLTLVVQDDDGGVGSHTITARVRNVPPTVTPVEGEVFVLGENDEPKLLVTFSDPGALDTHHATIHWGDGSAAVTTVGGAETCSDAACLQRTVEAGGVTLEQTLSNIAGVRTVGTVTGAHAYAGLDGPFPRTVPGSVTITDKDGGQTTVPVNITVTNLAIPGLTFDAGQAPPAGGGALKLAAGNMTNFTAGDTLNFVEGDTVNFTGSFAAIVDFLDVDPFAPTYTYTWDFGDGNTTAPLPANPGTLPAITHVYADNGVYIARLIIRAFNGATLATLATKQTVITVNNAPPQVTAGGETITEGETATVSGSITDPGIHDTFTVLIDWGPGQDRLA